MYFVPEFSIWADPDDFYVQFLIINWIFNYYKLQTDCKPEMFELPLFCDELKWNLSFKCFCFKLIFMHIFTAL